MFLAATMLLGACLPEFRLTRRRSTRRGPVEPLQERPQLRCIIAPPPGARVRVIGGNHGRPNPALCGQRPCVMGTHPGWVEAVERFRDLAAAGVCSLPGTMQRTWIGRNGKDNGLPPSDKQFDV